MTLNPRLYSTLNCLIRATPTPLTLVTTRIEVTESPIYIPTRQFLSQA